MNVRVRGGIGKAVFLSVALAILNARGGVLGEGVRVEAVPDRAMGVELVGRTLYAIGGGELVALDVSSPLKPVVLGRLPGMSNNRQIVVRDGFAYVVSRETGLRIVDVRDPKAMKLCSRFDSVEFATGIDVVGKTAFLSERIYGVEVVDVSDPYRPRHVCMRKTDESQSNRYRNGYLYSGEWATGKVTVFDAHDLRTFRAIGTLDLGGFGDGLEIADGYLYCSTGHDALHARRATCGSDKTGAGRGLDIFDLSDPARPKHVSRVDFPVFKPRQEDFWTPRVANGFAFCCDSHNGLFVVDVRDPKRPSVVDRFCVKQVGKDWPSGAISSCAVGEGCVYVTSYPGGLWVVPVSGVAPQAREKGTPPLNPDWREAYPTDEKDFFVYRPETPGQARTVALAGDRAYCAFGDAGLHVLKVDPERGFTKIGELPGNRRVTDCCLVGETLLTAEGLDGWAVYELQKPFGFKEVSRRLAVTSDGRTPDVAFWCWNADARHVILSRRVGEYSVVPIDGFANARPVLAYRGTCQWDRYLPEAAIGGLLPTLVPYTGLVWVDFNGKRPFVALKEKEGPQSAGTQCNGVCRFDAERFLYTVGGGYCFLGPGCAKSSVREFPPFGKRNVARIRGMPRSDGRLVVLTSRSTRRFAVYDFAEPDNPKPESAYVLSGNPDQAAIFEGRAIVPAGHQGVVMERRAHAARTLTPVSPKEGAVVPLLSDGQKAYFSLPREERVAKLADGEFRRSLRREGYHPMKVRLAWQDSEPASASTRYAVEVVRKADRVPAFVAETERTDIDVDNLEIACDYVWTVRAKAEGRAERVLSGSFSTEDFAPRFIRIDGVANVRDLGGRIGLGGRRVRQGLVVRSAGLNVRSQWTVETNGLGQVVRRPVSPVRSTLKPETVAAVRERFGFRTDLDLRAEEECFGMTGSPLGPTVKWVHVPSSAYGGMGSAEGRAAFRKTFAVFLDERNYPIDFHCISGADRTGSVAYILGALLGCRDEDLWLDWEATAFWNANDKLPLAHKSRGFFNLVKVFEAYPGTNTTERVEGYVKSLGFTDDDIARFRKIMFSGKLGDRP